MKLKHLNGIRMGVAAALLLSLTLSCRREVEDVLSEPFRPSGTRVSFFVEDLQVPSSSTKTVLSDPDIETKVTTLTLAIYRSDGSLSETAYYTSGFDSMNFLLEMEQSYTIYALANMGDMRECFPESVSSEESLGGIQYLIPGYTVQENSIERRGIPMVGKLVYTLDNLQTQELSIPLRRLLAKLAVDLNVHWDGAISSIRICGLNRRLSPFGTSRALDASDILADEEMAPGTDESEGTFVFYIPENEQGSIAAITSSSDKSPDNDLAIPPEKAALLTYMEVGVEGRGNYEGSMTYRSYLGRNATSDFSITRNCRYSWKVDYLQDGTFLDNWKHENELAWWSQRYKIQVNNTNQKSVSVYIGERFSLKLFRADDRYENGILKSAGSFNNIFTDNCLWTVEDYNQNPDWVRFSAKYQPAGVTTYDYREYLAASKGSGYIKGTLKSELGSFSDRILVTCPGIRVPVYLQVSSESIELGESLQFTVTAEGVDITFPTYLWYLDQGIFGYIKNFPMKEDTAFYFISREGSFTPTITGNYELYCIYAGIRSNSVSFTVSEPGAIGNESHILSINPVWPDAVKEGEEIRLTASLKTYRNKTLIATTDVTNKVHWSCDEAEVRINKGVATSSRSGYYTVRASYTPTGGNSVAASVQLCFLPRPLSGN